MTRLTVIHVITGLNVGGAEQMLVRLLPGLEAQGVANMVLSLTGRGPLARAIEASGVRVLALNLPAGRPPLRGLGALVRLLRHERPDVVQGWLYHANLLAAVAGRLSGDKVLWNIRSASPDLEIYGRSTALAVRAGAWLSPWPRVVIANSNAARRQHEVFGYRPRRWALIPNGFDLDRFRPDADAYRYVREELGLPPEARLVGHFGRFHPVKRHDVLLAAAARLLPRRADAHVLLAGSGVTADNPALRAGLPPELARRVHFFGERHDLPRLMAALDALALSSDSESFPNVVGEAMACGVPCVVTDVGDAAEIVGPTGIVVPPGDGAALADGLDRLLALPPEATRALGAQARSRIEARYSLSRIVEQYGALYRSLVETGGPGRDRHPPKGEGDED